MRQYFQEVDHFNCLMGKTHSACLRESEAEDNVLTSVLKNFSWKKNLALNCHFIDYEDHVCTNRKMFFVCVFPAWIHGDPRKVVYPTDSHGQFCGQQNTPNAWVKKWFKLCIFQHHFKTLSESYIDCLQRRWLTTVFTALCLPLPLKRWFSLLWMPLIKPLSLCPPFVFTETKPYYSTSTCWNVPILQF